MENEYAIALNPKFSLIRIKDKIICDRIPTKNICIRNICLSNTFKICVVNTAIM